MEAAVFIVAAAIVLTGALGVVLGRNPVHSALFLVQTLFGVALLFVLQEAHFLAAVQVIVYAGAIVILFLFVIMLLGVDRVEKLGLEPIAGQRPVAVVLGAALVALGVIGVVVGGGALTGADRTVLDAARGLSPDEVVSRSLAGEGETDIEVIGRVLFTDFAFAFLITAGLLTIAVIGAVVLTRRVGSSEWIDEEGPQPLVAPPPFPASADDDHHPGGPGPHGGDDTATDDEGAADAAAREGGA